MSGLRINEVEDASNKEIEDDSEKIYHGPGYWRKGNDYHFGATPQPSPPSKSSSVESTNRPSDRLAFALNEQKAYLEELEGKLQSFADKTLSNLQRGGPVVRSGEFASITAEILERKFLCQIIEEELSKLKVQG